MGLGIRLAITSRAYSAVAALGRPERRLLDAIRAWATAFRRAEAALPQLRADMVAAGVNAAAFSAGAFMAIVERTARRTVDIHCPRCINLSEDEQCMLQAASLAQVGADELAAQALRTALLTAQGTDFALGPLGGLGEIFAAAGLLFRRQRPSQPRYGMSEAWTPSAPKPSQH